MTTPEHSPLPWKKSQRRPYLLDADGNIVIAITPANAGLIVTAVNSSAERVELLAAAKAIYQAVHGDTIAVGPLWGRLHAAIAAAETNDENAIVTLPDGSLFPEN